MAGCGGRVRGGGRRRVLVVASGLPATIVDRFEHPHSDDRRTELALKTVQSVALGSPVVGFGNTRDVRGNFSSIAGGSTPECDACGVPPFGTQGQFWLVLFAQGIVGAIAFVWFLLYRMGRHLRARDLRTVTSSPRPCSSCSSCRSTTRLVSRSSPP